MAKSIRSKIKKRFRTAKRQRVTAMIEKPRTARKNAALQEVINGTYAREGQQGTASDGKKGIAGVGKRNAFLYPNDKDAEIPQATVKKPIDFRASHNLAAGYAFRGNRRKYDAEEQANHESLRIHGHPEEKIVAGKGAAPGVNVEDDVRAARKAIKKRLAAGNIVEVGDDGKVLKTKKKTNSGEEDADGDAAMDEDVAEVDDAASSKTRDTEDGVVIIGDSKNLAEGDTKRIPIVKNHSGNKKVAKSRGEVSKKMRSGGVKKR